MSRSDERLERNKRAVTAFYDLMFNQSRPAARPPSSPTSSAWPASTRASTWRSSG